MSAYQQFREWLIDSGALHVVVEFPARLLAATSIQLVMLELNRPTMKADSEVLMIDAMSYLTEARAGRFELTDWKNLATI